MTVALSIVAVLQALALGAVALRAVWPSGTEDHAGLDQVSGSMLEQAPDEDYYESETEQARRVGFRAPRT